jgi:hypothetical protein
MSRSLILTTAGLFLMSGCVGFGLSGCGAVNNVINSQIRPVNNVFGFDGQTIDTVIGGTRAAVSGSGILEVVVADGSVPAADRVRFVNFTQSLQTTVTVTVPPGVALPAQFSVSDVSLTVALRDAAPRSVSVARSISGPVTFVRVGATNQYQTTTSLIFSGLEIRNDFGTFRDIYTAAPTPNIASIRIALDTDSNFLPLGSVIRFTLTNGSRDSVFRQRLRFCIRVPVLQDLSA